MRARDHEKVWAKASQIIDEHIETLGPHEYEAVSRLALLVILTRAMAEGYETIAKEQEEQDG